MKLVRLSILFLVALLCNNLNVFCQSSYEDWTYRIKEMNKPVYSLYQISEISSSGDTGLAITIDTTMVTFYNSNFSNPYVLGKTGFGIYKTDSAGYQNMFISNVPTNQAYSLGRGNFRNFYSLKNCFVTFCRSVRNEPGICVFNYSTREGEFHKLLANSIIGQNDSVVFLAPYDFKLYKKKYRQGTIVSLNENGIRVLDSVFEKHKRFDPACLFYSDSYSVYKHLDTLESTVCFNNQYFANKELIKSVRINYFDQCIDSFKWPKDTYYEPSINMESDTLLVSFKDEMYRRYFQSEVVGRWDWDYWKKRLIILYRCRPESCSVKGNLIFMKTSYSIYNTMGLVSHGEDGGQFTLNGVPLKNESTHYSLILVFDMQSEKFLGYPKIQFVSGK